MYLSIIPLIDMSTQFCITLCKSEIMKLVIYFSILAFTYKNYSISITQFDNSCKKMWVCFALWSESHVTA